MAKKNNDTGTYEVTMRCIITKLVTVESCTEEQCRENPWEYATDEHELDQIDWTVTSVKRID